MSKKTKADPTGQAGNRNKGTRVLTNRLTMAERSVKALFRAIPRTRRRQAVIQNAEQSTFYDYEFSAQDQEQLDRSIRFILDGQLLETQTDVMPFDWYWKSNVELPYRQGTTEEVRDFNQLIAGAIVAGVLVKGFPPQQIPIERVLFSESYRAALNNVFVSNFSSIKTLSNTTASQVIQRINAGIEAGRTPTVIAADITDRFDVSKVNAKRIAETKVNEAYNNAKLAATNIAGEETGLRSGVIHISALTPTTRAHHAARHGNAYTVEDQTSWWNEGANRINCKCSVRSILIDKRGNVVQSDIQAEIKEERVANA